MANVLTSCDHPQNEKLPHKIFNKHDDLVNDKALPALPLKATAIRKSGEACKRSYKKGQIFFSSSPPPYEPLAGRRVTTGYSLVYTLRGFEDARG